MRVSSLDFAHAYKHVGLAADQLDCAAVVLSDPQGGPMMASLRTKPSGPQRGPANWERASTFLQFVIRKVFGARIGIFVDDFCCVEPQCAIASAFWAVREICAILGLELARPNEKLPCSVIDILGATIRVGQGEIAAELTAHRCSDYVTLLRNVLRMYNLSPSASAKARGGTVIFPVNVLRQLWAGHDARFHHVAVAPPIVDRPSRFPRPGGNDPVVD